MKQWAILWHDKRTGEKGVFYSQGQCEMELGPKFPRGSWRALMLDGYWKKVRVVYSVKVRNEDGERLCYWLSGRDHCFMTVDWERWFGLGEVENYRDVSNEYYMAQDL